MMLVGNYKRRGGESAGQIKEVKNFGEIQSSTSVNTITGQQLMIRSLLTAADHVFISSSSGHITFKQL